MNRSELGPALRTLREASGKEAKTVARGAVMSTSKLSKIENGRAAVSVADVDRILTAIGVSEAVKAEYMAAARAEATEATAWRLYRRLGYHRKQRQIKAMDSSTTLLRIFQTSLVPGLLQTPEFARAVFARKDLGEEQLSRAVSGRLDRQGILHDPAKTLQFVILESVLRWGLVSAPAMVEQLDRIVSVSRLPAVDVRVMPLVGFREDVPGHSFVVRDDRLVTVETVHAELVVTDPRDVDLYVRKFEKFSSAALAGEDMRVLVEGIRDEFLRERETG
ncbi:helix-turn-helix domain-containing protein [Kitasatospora sp. NA04385]|uniref:helix-turn-helix domain-containing protein n=1 Tax=Kitasatospora sp. NA04385 TaxID=2742135 RepID=UPI001591F6C2|nr:helix-turn-helix transcriptional regulator [Kitasatospora sp. NA04385]QKW22489.1 helix-turn-helix domain-containing protein [Kitasatospora sp. NA04385]